MSRWAGDFIAFVDPDPTRAIPAKLADALRLHATALQTGRAPPPPLPEELLQGDAPAADEAAKGLTVSAGAAVNFAASDWVEDDDAFETTTTAESAGAPSSAAPAGGTNNEKNAPPTATMVNATAQRDAAKVIGQLFAVRGLVMADLLAATRELHPKPWAQRVIPRISRYVALLEHMAANGWRDLAWFYWHPSERAVCDVHFDAASVWAAAGACEMRAAACLVRRATATVANAANTYLAARVQAAKDAEEDRRLAYKFLCSAALRFETAAKLMQDAVEPRIPADGTVKSPTDKASSSSASPASAEEHLETPSPSASSPASPRPPTPPPALIHPALSSEYYRALGHLALAQGQEIGVHRAVATAKGEPVEEDESVPISRARPTDALAAALSVKAAEHYDAAFRAIRLVPAPTSAAARTACAKVFNALEKYALAKRDAWSGFAHALMARKLLGDEAGLAVAHCQKAVAATTTARRHAGLVVTLTEERAITSAPVAGVRDATVMLCAHVETIAAAVERMNDLVTHARPTDADVAAAKLPAARDLAHPVAFTPQQPQS